MPGRNGSLMRVLRSALASATLISSTVLAVDLPSGIRPSASFDVRAGLDRSTRELIDGLPKTIREETYKLLKDALPLLDESVHAYLEHVNAIIDAQIDHFSCSMKDAAATIGDMFKSSIVGGRPQVVANIEKEWAGMDKAFKSSTSPHQMMTSYADFLVNATVTACRVAATPQAARHVDRIQDDARRRWTLWSRLDGQCKDADNCFTLVSARVGNLIIKSDRRDVDVVQATARHARIVRPQRSGLFSPFRQAPYEDQLQRLLSVQDEIYLARLARESVGKQLFASAKSKVDAAEAALKKANKSLSKKDLDKNESAKKYAGSVARYGEGITTDLSAAVAQVAQLGAAAKAESERYQTIAAQAPKIVAEAKKRQEAILKKQLETIREPRDREGKAARG